MKYFKRNSNQSCSLFKRLSQSQGGLALEPALAAIDTHLKPNSPYALVGGGVRVHAMTEMCSRSIHIQD